MELLEADGLEDAMLVILPGEQDKRQGSKQSPSEQGETSTTPKIAQISVSHPAGPPQVTQAHGIGGTSQARYTREGRLVPSVTAVTVHVSPCQSTSQSMSAMLYEHSGSTK